MTRTRTLIMLTMLLLLAFGLRVYALGDKALWWDEAWSVGVSEQSFGEVTIP